MEVVVLSKTELAELLRQNAVAVVAELRNQIEAKPTPELMTKSELAIYLKCSIPKIDYLMKKDLPFERCGDQPRYRKTKIDEWLSKK